MRVLTQRLEHARPVIEKILLLSGTVGLSYGILHEGKIVHTENFGLRDHDKELAVNEDTIFPLCSLTKAMVAAGVGILVDDGRMLLDYLSMRTGMQQYATWLQSQNNIIFPASESLKIINSLQQIKPLRHSFQYDNWAYEIASQVFPKAAGVDWGSFLWSNIFKPLGLKRTGTRADMLDSSNVARAYTVLNNATPVLVRDVQLSDETLMGGAGGARSCVADLLEYYAAFLDAYQDQASSGKTTSAQSPFKQVIPMTSAHSEISVSGFDNQAYCMGWVKGRLPGPLGLLSNNFGNLGANVPEIGKNGSSMSTLNHAGSMAGAMTGIILFPESKSAIIVLTNTLGLTDTADTVSQLLTEILFDLPEKHDFVGLTQKIVDVERKSLTNVAEKLEQERTLGTTPRDLNDYVGTYRNVLGTMKVEILLQDKTLVMRFQDLEEETFAMQHYEYDTFTWWFTRDECARRGRFTNYGYEYFRINFAGKADMIDCLTWKTASQLKEPEMFKRVPK
jgi:CubicO group peptidase (beta-lactamase class C family)